MKILGLPGIKPETEQWMSNLLNAVELDQTESTVQRYRYWSNPAGGMKMEMEAAAASMAKPDIVIAKSIGTRVALHAFANGLLDAKSYIFLGVPLSSYTKEEIAILKNFCNVNSVLLIQQANDPLGSYSDLAAVIPDSKTSTKTEIPGSDHQYGDIKQLKGIIGSWYKGNTGFIDGG